MTDGLKEAWVRAKDAAREYPPLQYQEVYRACIDGKIKAEQRGRAAWYCWRPDLELMAIKAVAVRDGVTTPEEFDAMSSGASAVMATLRDNLTLWSKLLVQIEVVDRTMEADKAEAIADGNLDLAATIQDARDHMRAAKVAWNEGARAWTLTIEGVGRATTQPVPA
jgi:hypothetical protein